MTEIDEADVLDAIEQALAEDRRDDAGGGVASQTIADILDCSQTTVIRRLSALAEAGDVVTVWGVSNYQARRSYLPAGHPDTDWSQE